MCGGLEVTKRWISAAAVLGVITLTACGPREQEWSTQEIRGAMPDLQFELTDEHGDSVREDAFRGDYVLLFFGYTHCPDVCPATLAVLNAALKQLGPDADRIKVLFVSVDPERDGPKELASYTSNFGENVVGLTGTHAQLDKLTKRYRVTYRHDSPDEQGDYRVYHSGAVFAFDPQGRVRLLMSYTDGLPDIIHDLGQLVSTS